MVSDARKGLLIEARNFTRELNLVTTDWRLYEGTARVFRPHPWEEMAAGVLWTLSIFGRPPEFVANLAGLRSTGIEPMWQRAPSGPH